MGSTYGAYSQSPSGHDEQWRRPVDVTVVVGRKGEDEEGVRGEAERNLRRTFYREGAVNRPNEDDGSLATRPR